MISITRLSSSGELALRARRGRRAASPVRTPARRASSRASRSCRPPGGLAAVDVPRLVVFACVQLVGAVRHLVHDRLRVGPQPGDRPQQPAEHQRQQAQRADRLELRMVPLVGDLLRQDVHQPEQHDEHDRDDEDHEEGDEVASVSSGSGESSEACGHPAGRPAAGRAQVRHRRSAADGPPCRAASSLPRCRRDHGHSDLRVSMTTHDRLERAHALAVAATESTGRAITMRTRLGVK